MVLATIFGLGGLTLAALKFVKTAFIIFMVLTAITLLFERAVPAESHRYDFE
ncbi:MAG: hypothetical protein JJ896_11510 [Rhodothermales bacterium]|nr:hypothetical protein [Rhodothermales bacterium]MBO6780270.1 hypothetical protein [Rhodothermales bacterium]